MNSWVYTGVLISPKSDPGWKQATATKTYCSVQAEARASLLQPFVRHYSAISRRFGSRW